MKQSSNTFTSASLIMRVRGQSPEAWRELIDLYAPLVGQWCLRRGLQPTDVADVMQEIFISVVKNLDRFQPRDEDSAQSGKSGSFRAWLWTIAKRRIADWYRLRGSWPEVVGGSSHMRLCQAQIDLDQDEGSLDHFNEEPSVAIDIASLHQRAMQQVQKKVAPQTWQAFWRCVVDGQRTEQVASELGLSINSVRQARSRILRRIREQLGDC